MKEITRIVSILTDRDCKKVREIVESLLKLPPEKLDEIRTFPGNATGEPLRILALVIVLVIRKKAECLNAVLEAVGASHLEIPVEKALTIVKEKVK